MPRWTEIVSGLPATVPFVGPEAQERRMGRRFSARLGANESVFGPSPKAVEAMQKAAAGLWMYGDPESHDLRHALAQHHGIKAENIVVGEGIDGLLGTLVRLLVGPGTPVVTSDGAYPTFNYHVASVGGALTKVPYRDDAEDAQGLAKAAQSTNAALVYLANPDNPMGSWISAGQIAELISALPPDTLLCLDEAYCDFAPRGAIPPLDVTAENIVRMRTFSKGYGLAGARVGYAIGAETTIRAFEKIRNHFGMNRLAQIGALAALEDDPHLRSTIFRVRQSLANIGEIAGENGLRALPSATNFATIDCGRDGAFARALVAALAEAGVFVRMPFVAPQDRCIRISAGRPQDLKVLRDALPKALAAIR
ncbi:pyridoxal phosphate-dependent aminotransferase [Algicella marina]|uniref:histidinol-phosphate transaminase n=1 Tax=Algicella marina TaxID=2683284 RepID=A0A6P1T4Y6_9RHOB|nr:pyridoxal phosphate-dependent aminotransferase [Algicella marina]QHQ35612.1 pyridoxal phosphate-dependent aminotransferase [Algicella marina]